MDSSTSSSSSSSELSPSPQSQFSSFSSLSDDDTLEDLYPRRSMKHHRALEVGSGEKKDYEEAAAAEKSKFFNFIASLETNDSLAGATLECDSVIIPCHRVVLAARSDHFKNLFTNERFIEGQTRKVKIQDMSVATLKAMLKFIYSNVLDDEGTDFSSLHCLAESLTVENASEFFHKAFLTESAHLKMASMKFVSKNFSHVIMTDGWEEFRTSSIYGNALEALILYITNK